jgi:hypothetical protein
MQKPISISLKEINQFCYYTKFLSLNIKIRTMIAILINPIGDKKYFDGLE